MLGEGLRISFDLNLGLILVNGTTIKNDAVRAAPISKLTMNNNNLFQLHIIVDHSIVEIIVNDDIAFVIYVAPSSINTLGNVRTFGSDDIKVDIWKLKDANI